MDTNCPNCLNCKNAGLVTLKGKNQSSPLIMFCRTVTLIDGSHPTCGAERSDDAGQCGVVGNLFEPRVAQKREFGHA